MLKRRDLLGSAVAGASLVLAPEATLADGAGPRPTGARPPKRPLLINRPRAEAEMTRAGLDAIVVREPSNVYYASNHWSVHTDYGSQMPMYAVIPRQATRPVIAVMARAELWALAEDAAEFGPMIVFAGRSTTSGVRPSTFNTWPVAKGATLGAMEKRYLEAAETHVANAQPDAMSGVAKALAELGAAHGRVGYDDARIRLDMGVAGVEAPTFVDATAVMLRIRQVKTAAEIALLRRAAQTSADSILAAVGRLQKGATQADLRAMFRAEAGARGAGYINLAVGGPDFANHHLEPGKPFMIDAVATVDRYCGDFGRTVVLGEPTEKVRLITRRAAAAWEGVYRQLRPGLRFSEVRGIALAAATKAGFDVKHLGAGPHSVGLQHSEDPIENGVMADFVMEPGMVVSVDHPYIEWGWGTAHLEDLSVITAEGVEPLNVHSEPLVVV